MNETMLGLVPVVGSLFVIIGAVFYMLGGRSNKFLRRFIGSLFCATAPWITALVLGVFNVGQLLIYPLTALYFSLGYDGGSPSRIKVLKRVLIVVCSLLTGLVFCLTVGGKSWLLLPVQFVIAVPTVWLGTKSILPAAVEEFFICLLLNECLIFYPFVAYTGLYF